MEGFINILINFDRFYLFGREGVLIFDNILYIWYGVFWIYV